MDADVLQTIEAPESQAFIAVHHLRRKKRPRYVASQGGLRAVPLGPGVHDVGTLPPVALETQAFCGRPWAP